MIFTELSLPGLFLIEPQVFGDHRGHFFESYNAEKFKAAGLDLHFAQDNQSLSNRGVLRGLHFQNPPYEQGKLVRVIKGAVFDVAVDIRVGSPTYGKHLGLEISEENKQMIWIPPGFAHGFLTLKDQTIFSYKCTGLYHPESEGSIAWNDTDLSIDWNFENPRLSEKDKMARPLKELNSDFIYA